MLAVSLELLHGTFRGDPDGAASTGGAVRGEWPPFPSRLFAAFVAADGTGERCRVTDGTELEWFQNLPAPVIRACANRWEQALHPRYVAEHQGSAVRNTHQEYVGRKGVLMRPGRRVAPRCPLVIYSWDAAAPSETVFGALKRRASRIGYLGAADSPVRVRVLRRLPSTGSPADIFTPDPRGTLMLNVPARGDLRILDEMYAAWVARGPDVARSQYPALRHEAPYRPPWSAVPEDRGEVVAWLRLETAVSGRRIGAVTAVFKEAVLSKYQELHGEPPALLHGHGFTADGYDLVRFLALPDVGFERSRGRIHGLAVWLPAGSDPAVRMKVRDAALAVQRLTGHAVDIPVAPHGGEARPWAAHPDRWTRSSRAWATAFPAIHERRRTPDLAEVARWCLHAGLPAPVAFRTSRTPLIPGAVDLAPVEVNRPGKPGPPYSHIALRFERRVRGPVVIGSGRQRGFGLCAPLDPPPAAKE